MQRKEEKRISKSISMTPSLWQDIQNLADSRGITASELIISTMSDVVRKHAKTTENFLKAQAEFKKARQAALDAAISNDDELSIKVEGDDWFNLVCRKGNAIISSVEFQSHNDEAESAENFTNNVLAIAPDCNLEVYQDEDESERVIAAYVDEEGNEQTNDIYFSDKTLARAFVEFVNEVLAA